MNFGRVLFALAFALGLHGCADRPAGQTAATPIVAGLATDGLDARVRGLVLLGELGCVACHSQAPDEAPAEARRGPDLATVGGRVQPDHLVRFLTDPHLVQPGTPMPDVLRSRDAGARREAAESLAHYLRSFSPAASAPEPSDPMASARGRKLFHEIGCVACHAPRDEAGVELPLTGSVPLGRLQDKYALSALRAFLLAPHEARPAARMPDLHLAPGEAHDLAHYLLSRERVAAAVELTVLDAAKVAAGRALFAECGCAACHALPDSQRAPPRVPAPLKQLDTDRGCMSGDEGPWPAYALSADQRADLEAALAALGQPLTDELRIQQLLASRNCTACHQRGDVGRVTPERNPHFLSADPTLGEEGRLPPPLTGVGAKLQRAWLLDAIAHGQSIRPSLRTRMPGFGAEFAETLTDLLARTDKLPPLEIAALPTEEKQARAVTDLGAELVGDRGMSCITCHLFAGEQVGMMSALDLVDSTAQRLRPEWFAHFMLVPSRFRPGTLMPQYFVDGVSARPQLGGGDVTRQIEALWHYLAEGRNVRKPSGMRPLPIELVVRDEAVMLRRSVQGAGKRGISVGYPLGVHFTFDAEHLGLNQIWWGKFVDAAPVWNGQGSGEVRILGTDRATLPNGPAFVALPDADAPWPEASRRDLGHAFLGYDLDARQRPAFRYVCEGVTITDAPVDVPDDAPRDASDNAQRDAARDRAKVGKPRPLLRRTLTFVSDADKTLHFRAARHARIDDLGAGLVQVGPSLRLRLPAGSARVRSVGEEFELVVEIPIRQGRAELVIEYLWHEARK